MKARNPSGGIMQNKRYKPLIDKLFYIMLVPTAILTISMIVLATHSIPALIVTSVVAAAIIYLFISPLFGYVELREGSIFIKYGLFLAKEIPYGSIRGVEKERKFYCDSMLSLKGAFEHVNIKYGKFDVTTVSVKTNDALIRDIGERTSEK